MSTKITTTDSRTPITTEFRYTLMRAIDKAQGPGKCVNFVPSDAHLTGAECTPSCVVGQALFLIDADRAKKADHGISANLRVFPELRPWDSLLDQLQEVWDSDSAKKNPARARTKMRKIVNEWPLDDRIRITADQRDLLLQAIILAKRAPHGRYAGDDSTPNCVVGQVAALRGTDVAVLQAADKGKLGAYTYSVGLAGHFNLQDLPARLLRNLQKVWDNTEDHDVRRNIDEARVRMLELVNECVVEG